jgi:hypothetical protein
MGLLPVDQSTFNHLQVQVPGKPIVKNWKLTLYEDMEVALEMPCKGQEEASAVTNWQFSLPKY